MLMEKENKDVQFHAWQGTTFGVGWIIVVVVLNILTMFWPASQAFWASS
jgi:uncharacterized membrane protein